MSVTQNGPDHEIIGSLASDIENLVHLLEQHIWGGSDQVAFDDLTFEK